jgi:hypothetical protein
MSTSWSDQVSLAEAALAGLSSEDFLNSEVEIDGLRRRFRSVSELKEFIQFCKRQALAESQASSSATPRGRVYARGTW